jgi:hypothetical protein
VRDRLLLAAAAVVFLAGVVGAIAKPDPHVGPAACAARVARALHVDLLGPVSVTRAGDEWTATAASGRLVLRVSGRVHDITGVELLAGPGADTLERPAKLRALATRC